MKGRNQENEHYGKSFNRGGSVVDEAYQEECKAELLMT